MVEKKTALLLGYKCNNNCRFCYCGDKRDLPPMKTLDAKEQLVRARKRGSKFVDFLGGEPTIRKDLIELIKFAKKIGFETISITTNGRMLSNRDYAERIVDAGLNSIVFSIHGPTAEIHDFLTRVKGSFAQAVEGVKNIRSMSEKIYICTNTTITKYNIKLLPQIAELNAKLGADGMEFIFPHPRGNAYENFEEIVPHLSELIGLPPKVVGIAKMNGVKHCVFRYVPLCYLYCSLKNVGELEAKGRLAEQHIGPEFEDLEVEKNRAENGRVKGPQCFGCKYNQICEGVFKEYAEKRGLEELVPVA